LLKKPFFHTSQTFLVDRFLDLRVLERLSIVGTLLMWMVNLITGKLLLFTTVHMPVRPLSLGSL
jgi:hypothetical protein